MAMRAQQKEPVWAEAGGAPNTACAAIVTVAKAVLPSKRKNHRLVPVSRDSVGAGCSCFAAVVLKGSGLF